VLSSGNKGHTLETKHQNFTYLKAQFYFLSTAKAKICGIGGRASGIFNPATEEVFIFLTQEEPSVPTALKQYG